MQTTKKKMSTTAKMFVFGFPRIGASLVLGIVGFALFNLYTVGYQLQPFPVSAAIFCGYLSIAFSQFFLGWLSDRKYTKWGRRKPFIYIIAPIWGISFVLLLMPTLFLHNPSTTTLWIWLLVFDVIFEFCYGFTTPYGAWMAEQFEAKDRPKASQVINSFNFIGNGAMVIFTFIVLTGFTNYLKSNPGVIPANFFWSVILFADFSVALFYIGTLIMPTEPRPNKIPDMKENLKKIVTNKPYLMVVIMQGIASLAWIMVTTVMLSYTEKVLDFGTLEYMVAGVVLLLGIFIFLYIWRKIIAKLGKTRAIKTLYIVGAILLFFSILGIFPWIPRFLFGILYILAIAATLGGWYLFPGFMYADYAEDEAKRSDQMNAGIFSGFPSILLNIFQAFGTLFLGIILSMSSISVSTVTFSIGYVIWGPICTVILIGVFFFTKYLVKLDFAWEKERKDSREINDEKEQ